MFEMELFDLFVFLAFVPVLLLRPVAEVFRYRIDFYLKTVGSDAPPPKPIAEPPELVLVLPE